MSADIKDFLNNPTDYKQYNLNMGEKVVAFAVGALLAFFVLHIFFGNIIVDTVGAVVTGIVAQPILKNILKERRKNNLIGQFKDMLDSLSTSYSVGKNTTGSFEDAYKDMELQYGSSSDICLELNRINIGLKNVSSIEDMLADFADRSGIDDIRTFADVFYAINRRGGNIKTIIGETKSIICEKIEIEQEIRTITSSSANSLYIIMCLPLLIVPMVSGFSEDGDPLIGILTKIAAIILFVIAFLIGKKITSIKF